MPFDDTIFLKKNVDVLSFFSEEQLRLITAQVDRKTYKNGQTVVMQGEIANCFYIIKKGKVAVQVKQGQGKEKVKLAELKSGDFFGEVSLLENTAAIATIKAIEDDTEILMLNHDAFHDMLKKMPALEKALKDRIAARRQEKKKLLEEGKEEGKKE